MSWTEGQAGRFLDQFEETEDRDHSLLHLAPARGPRCQEMLDLKPVGRSEDWRQWKAICRRAGVREARQHDARHTAASLLVEQGVHLRTVQEILGHARITTTEWYAHVATPLAEEAAGRMGGALFG